MSEVTKQQIVKAQAQVLDRGERDDTPIYTYLELLEDYAHVPHVWKKTFKKPEGYEGLTELAEQLEGMEVPTAIKWMLAQKFIDRDDEGLVVMHDHWTGLGKEIHETVFDMHQESWHECTKVYLPRVLTDIIKGVWALQRSTQKSRKILSQLSKRASV